MADTAKTPNSPRAQRCPHCGLPLAGAPTEEQPTVHLPRVAPPGAAARAARVPRTGSGSYPGLGDVVLARRMTASAVAILAVAIGLLAAGLWAAGVALLLILMAATALLAPPALGDLVRQGRGAATGAYDGARGAATGVRGRLHLARVWVAAWLGAARELLRARRQQQRLHSARRQRVAALGDAVVRGDYARAASVKAETRQLGAEIQERDRRAAEAVRLAREQIERERAVARAAARPTRIHAGSRADD